MLLRQFNQRTIFGLTKTESLARIIGQNGNIRYKVQDHLQNETSTNVRPPFQHSETDIRPVLYQRKWRYRGELCLKQPFNYYKYLALEISPQKSKFLIFYPFTMSIWRVFVISTFTISSWSNCHTVVVYPSVFTLKTAQQFLYSEQYGRYKLIVRLSLPSVQVLETIQNVFIFEIYSKWPFFRKMINLHDFYNSYLLKYRNKEIIQLALLEGSIIAD